LFFFYCDSDAALMALPSSSKHVAKQIDRDRTRWAPCKARWVWAGAVTLHIFW
jgi:hypothetical protein